MKLSAESKTINEILSRNIFYEVPRNQRKYVWDEQQLEELYDDIFNNEDGSYHFMGCIVLEQSCNDQEDRYKIIDGQQRLTTFNILILIVSKLFFELNDIKKANSNKKYIIGDVDGDEINKILVDESYLNDLISCTYENKSIEETLECLKYNGIKSDKYNVKVLNAYMFFYKKLLNNLDKISIADKIKKLTEYKNKLMNVNIIEIKVPYDDNATMGYKIFEVLNARGIPLEQHELIKNYIFKYLKVRKRAKTDKPKKQWESIVNNLVSTNADNMENFFSHYTIHKYGIKSSQKGEFEVIKSKCKKENVSNLLDDLVKKSKYYNMICNPEEYKKIENFSNKVLTSLEFFKDMKIRQVRPLVMSLFNCCDSKLMSLTVLEDMLEFLESFYFIYVIICKNKTNSLENIVSNFANKLENSFDAKLLEEMIESFNKYKISFEEFSANFKSMGYSNKNKKYKNSANKKAVFYILNKIERYYDIDNEHVLNKFSIEHIMCDSDENDSVAMIGNLLPLSGKRNNKISDSEFCEKIGHYKKSNILTVKKYLENYGDLESWTENDIIKRTEKISQMAYEKIWNYNK